MNITASPRSHVPAFRKSDWVGVFVLLGLAVGLASIWWGTRNLNYGDSTYIGGIYLAPWLLWLPIACFIHGCTMMWHQRHEPARVWRWLGRIVGLSTASVGLYGIYIWVWPWLAPTGLYQTSLQLAPISALGAVLLFVRSRATSVAHGLQLKWRIAAGICVLAAVAPLVLYLGYGIQNYVVQRQYVRHVAENSNVILSTNEAVGLVRDCKVGTITTAPSALSLSLLHTSVYNGVAGATLKVDPSAEAGLKLAVGDSRNICNTPAVLN